MPYALDAHAVQGVHLAPQPGGIHGGAPAAHRRPPSPLRALRHAGAGGLLPGIKGRRRVCGGGRLPALQGAGRGLSAGGAGAFDSSGLEGGKGLLRGAGGRGGAQAGLCALPLRVLGGRGRL